RSTPFLWHTHCKSNREPDVTLGCPETLGRNREGSAVAWLTEEAKQYRKQEQLFGTGLNVLGARGRAGGNREARSKSGSCFCGSVEEQASWLDYPSSSPVFFCPSRFDQLLQDEA